MKKIFFLIILMAFVISYADAQYFKGSKEPDFFVPDFVVFNAPEKVPTSKIRKTTLPSLKEFDNFVQEKKSVPDYKYKYDEYINDIMAYYSSGEMPNNPKLEKDLAEMNSDVPVEITAPAPEELSSKEMEEFYRLYQKILNN